MHEQKLKENNLGYIDPKQNRVITTHGFHSTFCDWSADKQITLVKFVSMYLHISCQMKWRLHTYVALIWKKGKA